MAEIYFSNPDMTEFSAFALASLNILVIEFSWSIFLFFNASISD
jgi:hypothetical protein